LADLDGRSVKALARDVLQVASRFDVLVIDTGAGVSDQVMQFLSMADQVAVVSTPALAATLDAYGLIKVARSIRVRGVLKLLINQVEDERQARSVYEKISACCRQFLAYTPGYLGHLVKDALVEAESYKRCPVVQTHPESPCARQLASLAGAVVPGRPGTTERDGEPDLVQLLSG
jgi:flagellar biosynthesis protein FlhG